MDLLQSYFNQTSSAATVEAAAFSELLCIQTSPDALFSRGNVYLLWQAEASAMAVELV